MKQQQQHRVLMRLIMMNRGSRRTSLLFLCILIPYDVEKLNLQDNLSLEQKSSRLPLRIRASTDSVWAVLFHEPLCQRFCDRLNKFITTQAYYVIHCYKAFTTARRKLTVEINFRVSAVEDSPLIRNPATPLRNTDVVSKP